MVRSPLSPQALLTKPCQANESGPKRLLNTAAYMIHSAIHTARPDVLCAAHTHSIHGKAFSTFGRQLDMLNQDVCAFYNVSLDPNQGSTKESSLLALGSRRLQSVQRNCFG